MVYGTGFHEDVESDDDTIMDEDVELALVCNPVKVVTSVVDAM